MALSRYFASHLKDTKPKDEEALKDEQIKRLKQKVGELVLDIDILKEAQQGRPFDRETSDE